jgi:hypothetical protein
MSDKIGTFAELRELIHVSLRTRMNPIATVQMNSRPTAEFSPPPCPKLHVVKDAAEIGMELSTRWEIVNGLSPTDRLIVNPSDSPEARIDNHKPICLDDEQYGWTNG